MGTTLPGEFDEVSYSVTPDDVTEYGLPELNLAKEEEKKGDTPSTFESIPAYRAYWDHNFAFTMMWAMPRDLLIYHL